MNTKERAMESFKKRDYRNNIIKNYSTTLFPNDMVIACCDSFNGGRPFYGLVNRINPDFIELSTHSGTITREFTYSSLSILQRYEA